MAGRTLLKVSAALFLALASLAGIAQTAPNEWTWIGGGSTSTIDGVYGTLGTPAPGNIPGGRQGPAHWKDSNGNFWLFGGYGYDTTRDAYYLNDVWEFNPSTKEWVWMGGSNSLLVVGDEAFGQPGVYGTLGTPAPGNIPGGRFASATWTDSHGNFWLFGGRGTDANANLGQLNDLWEFNPSTNEWAWMGGGSQSPGSGGFANGNPGVYGTQGTPASTNIPGGRHWPTTWTDHNGNLWLFGGVWIDDTSELNDLWEYNPTTNEWTWMNGSNNTDQIGVYGTLGTPAAGNTPGARYGSSSWVDNLGNLWLFGGTGYDASTTNNNGNSYLDEVWEYNPSTNRWAWMGGSNTVDSSGEQPGIFGSLGTPAPGNIPPGICCSTAWSDSDGNFWLLGGGGIGGVEVDNFANTLWEFNPVTNEWTWVGGNGTAHTNGNGPYSVYGTLGTPAAGNVPGGRQAAAVWTDGSGNVWLFGGAGVEGTTGTNWGYLNDFWEYEPLPTTAPATVTPTVTVLPSPSSITTAQSDSVTVTVSGGGSNPTPTGSVTLSSGTYTSATTTLVSGSAMITVPAGSLATGNDTLTATYSPDSTSSSTYNSATGSNSVTVTAATLTSQTITVTTAAPASAADNSTFMVAATASSGLPVSVTASGACSGSGTGSATITMTVATGTCTVTYTQAGNSTYAAAPTVTSSTTATAAPLTSQTITVTTAAPASAADNSTFMVAATASSGLPVSIAGSGSCTGSGTGSATITMTAATGTCTVTYTQAGNSTYAAAPTVTSMTAATAAALTSQTITVTTAAPASAADNSTFMVAATASSGLPVSIAGNGACSGSGTGSATITMTAVTGTCTVTYTQAGNSTYAAAPTVTSMTAATAAALTGQTITVTTAAPASAADNSTFMVAATASSGLPVSITASGSCSGSGTGSATITMTAATGTCTVTYNQAGNSTYAAAPTVTSMTTATNAAPVPTFTLSSTPGAQTVQPGASAQYTIIATAQNGTFSGTVALSASGLPSGATAMFSPASVVPGSTSANSTLTIQTPAQAMVEPARDPRWPLAVPALALVGFFFLPGKRRRRWISMAFLLIASLGVSTALTACGGGFGLVTAAPATSYNITVTGTSGSVVQTTTVQLTIE